MLEIGVLVNTHGIKGEVRILSDFKYKDLVFISGNAIYIDDKKYIIKSHRKHKTFDLICFNEFENINDVINLKGKNVLIDRNDYEFPGLLNEDLFGKKVYDKEKFIGTLKDIIKNKNQEIMVIENNGKEYLIPYVDEFVQKIDEDIHLDLIRGFIDED